jgi:hypothetical protein
MNKYTEVHGKLEQIFTKNLFPEGKVPWIEGKPADISKNRFTSRVEACGYCGSIRPELFLSELEAGMEWSWADFKYGWPHKIYLYIRNPFFGQMKVTSMANFQSERLSVQYIDGYDLDHNPIYKYRSEEEPEEELRMEKFYTIHLKECDEELKSAIEKFIGLQFTFEGDDGISWKKIGA